MSLLAKKLSDAEVADAPPSPRGPKPTCDIYGPGDLEDWRAVEELRLATSWAVAQLTVDAQLDVATPIPTNFFQYHWKRKCGHWPHGLRR